MSASPPATVRELKTRLQHLSAVLLQKSTGRETADAWEEQLEALHELHRIASSTGRFEREAFLPIAASYVKVPLLRLCEDQRTALARQSFKVMVALLEGAADHRARATMCAWFMPAVLSGTATTSRAIAAAAVETLDAFVACRAYGSEAIGQVLKGCRERHVVVRQNATRTLVRILRQDRDTSAQSALLRFATPLCRVVREGVVDADEEVRRLSRVCYWGLLGMDEGPMRLLYRSLELPVRRALDHAQAESMQMLGCPAGADTTPGPSADAETPVSKQPGRRSGGSSARRRPARTPETTAAITAIAEDTSPPSAVGSSRRKQTQQALQADLRAVAARAARSNSRPTPSPVWRRKRRSTVHADPSPPSCAATEASPAVHERWPYIKKLLTSTTWSSRLEGLEELTAIVPLLDVGLAPEVHACLAPRLSDPHFRVAAAAIRCADPFMERFPEEVFGEHLVDWIAALVVNLNGNKQETQTLSRGVLAAIVTRCPFGDLLTALLACLDDTATPRARERVLELLQYAAEKSPTQLTPSMIGQILRVAVPIAAAEANRKSSLFHAAANLLLSLYRENPERFVAQLLQLPSEQQSAVQSVLAAEAPQIERDCREHAASRGSLSSPLSARKSVSGPTSPFRSALEQSANVQQQQQQQPSPSQRRRSRPFSPHGPPLDAAAKDGKPAPDTPSPIIRGKGNTSEKDQRRISFATPLSPRAPPPPPSAMEQLDTNLFDTPLSPQNYEELLAAAAGEWEDGDFGLREGVLLSPARHDHEESASDAGYLTGGLAEASQMSTRSPAAPTTVSPAALCDLLKDRDSVTLSATDYARRLGRVRASLSHHRDQWRPQDVATLFGTLEKRAREAFEMSHVVRAEAFSCARFLVHCDANFARSGGTPQTPRALSRVVSLCRCGLDDAFAEVQQPAALLLHSTLRAPAVTPDMALCALAEHLVEWARGSLANEATRGRLEMLCEIGRRFEGADGGAVKALREDTIAAVVGAARMLLGHAAPLVRRTAVLVLVVVWLSLGGAALPFLASLDAAQQQLVTIYCNKVIAESQLSQRNINPYSLSQPTPPKPRDLTRELSH